MCFQLLFIIKYHLCPICLFKSAWVAFEGEPGISRRSKLANDMISHRFKYMQPIRLMLLSGFPSRPETALDHSLF